MSKVSDAIRELAHCPKCGARAGSQCSTKTGRSHTERARAAVREALAQEAEVRGALEVAMGLREEEPT